jgi:drug/metabolite transporter (DMT)-like permease
MSRLALILTAGSICAAFGQVALKVGASGQLRLIDFLNGWIAAGLISYGVGTLIWIYGLSRASLTVVYAFTGLTFALVYLAGFVALGERLSPRGLMGLGLVISGLALLMSAEAS